MKKKLWLIIPGILLLAIIAAVIWQWNNISAAIHSATTDTATIEKELSDLQQQNQKYLEDTYHVTVRPPTQEQTDALLNGTVSPEEVKKAYESASPPAAGSPTDISAIIAKYTAKLYAYRVDLMAKLGVLKTEVMDTWHALPKSERTAARRTSLITEGVHKCYVLEEESDNNVKAILDELRQELKAIGADTSAADELWKQYAEEKSAEKSYYFSKYLDE